MLRAAACAAFLLIAATGAEAASLQVRNCTTEMVELIPYNDDALSLPGTSVSSVPSSTVTVTCSTASCKIEAKFHHGSNSGWNYTSYSSDVCINSNLSSTLEPIGNCKC
jgi:hypothetical protein